MHNALVNPGSFVPPPRVVDQDPYFNPELASTDRYPTSSGFFSKDPLEAYSRMVKDEKKPLHLLDYDPRFLQPNNYFTRGNPLYTKNETLSREENAMRDSISPSQQERLSYANQKQKEPSQRPSPAQSPSTTRSPQQHLVPQPESSSPQMSSGYQDAPTYGDALRESKPDPMPEYQQPEENQFPEYAQESHHNEESSLLDSHHQQQYDEICRKQLPDAEQKRVVFQDQVDAKQQLYPQSQSSPGSGNYESEEEEEESEMSFQNIGKRIDDKMDRIKDNLKDSTANKDDSMSKLNEVLKRQRERLEQLGESGERGENIENAFQELEKEINHIKQNLDRSKGYSGSPSAHESSPGQYSLSASEYENTPQQPEYDLQPKFNN